MSHARMWKAGAAALIGVSAIGGACPTPQLRPGSAFDGSAHWAWQIADPLAVAFAPDAQLYEVLGSGVFHDGRLPSNTGTWSFVTWSAARHEVFQVTVNHSGTTTTSTRTQADPPGSQDQVVPAGWVNSTAVFQAAEPYRPGDRTSAQLVVFNFGTWTTPGQWGINYGRGPNLIVRWDGVFIGTQ